MGVYCKGNLWYFQYVKNGKTYRGKCENCKTEKQAKIYENKEKLKTDELDIQADKIKYLEKQIEKLRGYSAISLEEAVNLALEVSGKRRNKSSEKQIICYWNDFVSYIKNKYHLENLAQVKKEHALAYMNYISTNGRYNSTVSYYINGNPVQYSNHKRLSQRTLICIHTLCKFVFDSLKDRTGMFNPFDFPKTRNNKINREIYSHAEIEKILNSADTFVMPLFRFAFYTGLRLGDVCKIKWSDIDLKNNFISLKMSKTRKPVMIPILDKGFILELKNKSVSEDYVFPEQHYMYVSNRHGVCYRIKRFLESLGIVTTITRDTGRNQSVKDFHSCRHTFATICAENNIPLSVVQMALGHSSPEMTQIYVNHLRKETMQEQFKKFKII